MDILTVGLVIALCAAVVLLLARLMLFGRQMAEMKASAAKDEPLALMQQQIDNLRGQLEASIDRLKTSVTSELGEITGQVGKRLDGAASVIGGVHRQLGELKQSQLRILEVGKSISSLQEILRPPKMRGGMGESLLKNLLDQIMPKKEYYSFEYSFKTGDRVDAIIRIGERLVPVDAKFPLESFKRFVDAGPSEEKERYRKDFERDIKKHIDTIADKYILPDEGTYEFALMYIPAENVYYEAIIKYESEGAREGIFEHALRKKVIPVSPNSFYAYLQVIILGLKGLAVEKGTKEIIASLERLRGDFARFYDDFRKVGSHLNDSRASFDKAEKRLDRLSHKLTQIENPKEKVLINESSPS